MTARAFCTVFVDGGWHLHLVVHWVAGLPLLDLVGVGTCALQHGFQHFLISHQKVQFTGVSIWLQQLLRLFFGIMLRVDLKILEQIDKLRIYLPILAPPTLDRLRIRHLEYPLQRPHTLRILCITFMITLAGSRHGISKQVVIKLDDLRLDDRIGVEDFELRLIWDLAGMGIVTAEYIMDAISMSFFFSGLTPRLDNILYLPQSNRREVVDQLPCGHQFLTQHLFLFFLLH